MKKNNRDIFLNEIGWKRFLRSVKRAKQKRKRKAGLLMHQLHIEGKGQTLVKKKRAVMNQQPVPFPSSIQFLASQKNLFSRVKISRFDKGHLFLPETFSLLDNYEESYNFLRRLFFVLYHGRTEEIILDYGRCTRIDVDASSCMDAVLTDFIEYCNATKEKGIFLNPLR